MNKTFHITCLIVALTALIIACNKNDAEKDNLNAAYNDAASQTAYNDVVSIGDESVIDDDLTSFKLNDAEKISAPCASISRDSSSVPWTTTIDFGSVNCLCNDGKDRRGKIVVTHPPISMARDSGAAFHYEFIDHYVNNNKMLGYINVVDSGTTIFGNRIYYIDLVGGLELGSGQGSIIWESHQRKYFGAGYATPNTRLDDYISIFGNSSGTTQTGETFTSVISGLQRHFSLECRKHFFAGTVTITSPGNPNKIINYGETSPEVCDNLATVTVNGNTYTIDLDNTHE